MRIAWLALLAACGTTDGIALRFTPDPGAVGSELYECFAFSIDRLDGADIGGVALVAAESPVTLHHVSLYGSQTATNGPCLVMPTDAVPMHVWAPGGGDLELSPDIALAVPPNATHLIVQTHGLRTDEGMVEREIIVTPRREAAHRAGWLPLQAPTPALRPHYIEESTATCSIARELHLISTWPHMHRYGTEFHGRVVDGAPIVDVVPYVFDAQHAYPIDIAVAAGAAIETHCIWQNTTDQTVLPGPSINDEMCGQSMIAYPIEAAHCL